MRRAFLPVVRYLTLIAICMILAAGCGRRREPPYPAEGGKVKIVSSSEGMSEEPEPGGRKVKIVAPAPGEGGGAGVEPKRATFAVGTRLTEEGKVVADSENSAYPHGSEILVSVDLSGLQQPTTAEVRWYGPGGRLERHEKQEVIPSKGVVVFRSGTTGSWETGRYRIEIVFDDRIASTHGFELTG
jgi:hypothetical protein